jgi:hypothetical protein
VSGIRLDGRIRLGCSEARAHDNPIAIRVAEGASVPFVLSVVLYY